MFPRTHITIIALSGLYLSMPLLFGIYTQTRTLTIWRLFNVLHTGCVVVDGIPKLISGLNPRPPVNKNSNGLPFRLEENILL